MTSYAFERWTRETEIVSKAALNAGVDHRSIFALLSDGTVWASHGHHMNGKLSAKSAGWSFGAPVFVTSFSWGEQQFQACMKTRQMIFSREKQGWLEYLPGKSIR